METVQEQKEVSGKTITAEEPLTEEQEKRLDEWAEKKFGAPLLPAEAPAVKQDRSAEIPHLMLQLKLKRMEENEACAEIDNKINVLSGLIKDLNAERIAKAAPLIMKASDLEDQIIKISLEAGKGMKCDHGQVKYRKAYIKRSWSLDELDTACALDPYIKDKIWQFRDPKPVSATASVELFL